VTPDRDALITGIGLVSCLGEGPDAHWAALNAPGGFTQVVDTTRFAPWPVHPMVKLDLDKQIPKRGDQRQMEAWQRIGVYSAGLALEAAGVKGNAELLQRMDMIVAAGGGERDYAADEAILAAMRHAADPGALLNERLLADLRPTLFLAQLSNLLAGNISLVHGVVGSSRTFMGEEAAGTDAVRTACARIAAGQGELFLVGSSFNAERADTLMIHEAGGVLWKQPTGSTPDAAGAGAQAGADAQAGTGGQGWAGAQAGASALDCVPVWQRQAAGGGMVLGSVGCFLVIESRAHAATRGAPPIARITAIATDRCRRRPGESTSIATRQLAAIRPALRDGQAAVVSSASGATAPTAEEAAFLRGLGLPVRATATALGHSLEAAFPASLALAAMAVAKGHLFGPLEAAEAPMPGDLRQVLVTSWGLWRGEAMALVTVPE
jgi:3-oxoacyl-[acyl-carrier-protein] synthase II